MSKTERPRNSRERYGKNHVFDVRFHLLFGSADAFGFGTPLARLGAGRDARPGAALGRGAGDSPLMGVGFAVGRAGGGRGATGEPASDGIGVPPPTVDGERDFCVRSMCDCFARSDFSWTRANAFAF